MCMVLVLLILVVALRLVLSSSSLLLELEVPVIGHHVGVVHGQTSGVIADLCRLAMAMIAIRPAALRGLVVVMSLRLVLVSVLLLT